MREQVAKVRDAGSPQLGGARQACQSGRGGVGRVERLLRASRERAAIFVALDRQRGVTRARPVGVSPNMAKQNRGALVSVSGGQMHTLRPKKDPALRSSHTSAALQDLDPGLDPGFLRWDLAHAQA